MGDVVSLTSRADDQRLASTRPAIRTEAVYALFTGLDETKAAVRIAHELSRALDVPLTVIDFQVVQYPLEPDRPAGKSPTQSEEFSGWLHERGIEANVRVYMCRDPRKAFGMVFRAHSLIVVGGKRPRWLARPRKLTHALEAAGHFLVFVDEALHAS